MYLVLVLAFAGWFHSVASSPFLVEHLHTRDTNCSQPQADAASPGCWSTLNVTGWLQDWWSKNSASCGNADFATCFQFHANITGQSCSNNTQGGCYAPNAFQYQDSPQEYYVLWNLYSINNYFTQLWTAIGNANSILESNVLHLIQEFNPPKTKNVPLNDVLTALSSILVFLKIPEGSSLSDAAKEVGTQIFNAATVGPSVSKFLFPETGTLDSQVAQLGEIGSIASMYVSQYQHNVTQALTAINGDYKTFLAFANTTVFSNKPLSVQDLSDNVLQTLYTFIISRIMAANKIVVAITPRGSELPSGNIDPSTRIVQDWYANAANDTVYSMTNLGDIGKNYTSIMNEILGNYTTGELLFEGAVACNGGTINITRPSTARAQNFTFSCLSNAQICTWEQATTDTGKEFSNCPPQYEFGLTDCVGTNHYIQSRYPVGYWGAFLNESDWVDCSIGP